MTKRLLIALAAVGTIASMGCDAGGAGASDADTDSDSDTDTGTGSDSDECSDLVWGDYGNPAVGEVVQNWPFVGYADVDGDGAMDLDHMVGFSMNRLHCAGYQSAVVVLSSPG